MIFSSLFGAKLDRELGVEDSTILFTTARRKAAINEGMQEFAELTECLQRRAIISCTGGVAEYDLNASTVVSGNDFVRFSLEQVAFIYGDSAGAVTVLAGDDLPRRDVVWLHRYEPGWQVSTVASSIMQLPQIYYERFDGPARLLGFWPTPSTGSSASMTAVVPYVARPAPLTSDTSEPFTVNSSVRIDLRPYHRALVHFAAHDLEKLRKDTQASDRQLQRFLSYVTRYMQNLRRKNGQRVTSIRNYFRARREETVRGWDIRT